MVGAPGEGRKNTCHVAKGVQAGRPYGDRHVDLLPLCGLGVGQSMSLAAMRTSLVAAGHRRSSSGCRCHRPSAAVRGASWYVPGRVETNLMVLVRCCSSMTGCDRGPHVLHAMAQVWQPMHLSCRRRGKLAVEDATPDGYWIVRFNRQLKTSTIVARGFADVAAGQAPLHRHCRRPAGSLLGGRP